MSNNPVDSRKGAKALRLANNDEQTKPSKKKRIKSKLVAAMAGRTSKSHPGACATKLDNDLVHNHQYGPLLVNKTKMTRAGKEREFWVGCLCGNQGYMTSRKIFERAAVECGCMDTDCEYSKVEFKVWHNPEFAIWFQYSQIHSRLREHLTNEWGGYMMQGIKPANKDVGYAEFRKEINPLIVPDKGEWWVHLSNSVGGYKPGNLKVKNKPDPNLFVKGEVFVRMADMLVTVEELARSMGVSYNRALDLRGQICTDEEFVDALIGETTK